MGAARTSLDPLGAGALLLGVLIICVAVGALIGVAVGSAVIGATAGAVVGMPLGVVAVIRRYGGTL